MQGRQVLIGGVGYHWQRDASFGLLAASQLAALEWPLGVQVADLGYGALYVAQDLAGARPPLDRLILLASVQRNREPGRLYRYRWTATEIDTGELQERIREAGAGVVHVDHLLVIAQHFDALPPHVLVIELEPADVSGGEGLSPELAPLLSEVVAQVREEVLIWLNPVF